MGILAWLIATIAAPPGGGGAGNCNVTSGGICSGGNRVNCDFAPSAGGEAMNARPCCRDSRCRVGDRCAACVVAADDNAPSDSCKITSGGIGSGGNTVTCNFGLTPEQLKQLTEAAVKGATEPQPHQVDKISKTLGVTEDAAEELLKIVGEDPNIPEDKLAEALSKVAGDYNGCRRRSRP